MVSNLIAKQSRSDKGKFVGIGYSAFWALTVIMGVVLGTWSFEVATEPPSLLDRLTGTFDIFHRSGLLEFTAYIIMVSASQRISIWFTDGKKIIKTVEFKNILLSKQEKMLIILSYAILLIAAIIESVSIVNIF
jgi:hypothetical protein